jgi:signal transduction histidine kinase
MARQDGHFEAEGWRVRKDGSRFWANVAITSVHSLAGEHIGFAKVTRDLTERIEMENSLRESREQLRRLSAHLDKAREEERTRIAREIHDELGGTLTGLKMDVTQLQRYVGPEGRHKLEAYAQAINEAVKTVRRIATELRPAILDDFGLLAAMEWQLREFERRSGIHCHWHCTLEAVELPGDNTTAVFRVFQESLTNIARHAQASEVRVTCTRLGSQLHLEIVDNGIGIAPQQLRGTRSLGLVGMRERVRQLGGTVDVQGRPGQGTTVAVTLPLEPPAG